MKLDVSSYQLTYCAKTGCFRLAHDRHHTGSEAMWLRHFKSRSRTKRYREYKARYQAFQPSDISPLCRPCHEEVTSLNWELIMAFMQACKRDACSTWTWEEAEALMKFLKHKYVIWRDTPRSEYPISGILTVPQSMRIA